MTALSLSAVGGLWRKSGIALSADHLLALELSGEGSEGWLDLDGTHTSTSESENQVKSGFWREKKYKKINIINYEMQSFEGRLTSKRSLYADGNSIINIISSAGVL